MVLACSIFTDGALKPVISWVFKILQANKNVYISKRDICIYAFVINVEDTISASIRSILMFEAYRLSEVRS